MPIVAGSWDGSDAAVASSGLPGAVVVSFAVLLGVGVFAGRGLLPDLGWTAAEASFSLAAFSKRSCSSACCAFSCSSSRSRFCLMNRALLFRRSSASTCFLAASSVFLCSSSSCNAPR